MDSKFDLPDAIGSEAELVAYLREELGSPEKELFLVVKAEVGVVGSWRNGQDQELLACPHPQQEERKGSADSGVVESLPDLRDLNLVDLDMEDLLRRQSSGVWSDMAM